MWAILYESFIVRDDDSDDIMADDSQVNSPSVERRSPIHQPLNGESGDHDGLNNYECMSYIPDPLLVILHILLP